MLRDRQEVLRLKRIEVKDMVRVMLMFFRGVYADNDRCWSEGGEPGVTVLNGVSGMLEEGLIGKIGRKNSKKTIG